MRSTPVYAVLALHLEYRSENRGGGGVSNSKRKCGNGDFRGRSSRIGLSGLMFGGPGCTVGCVCLLRRWAESVMAGGLLGAR